jgi:hypothetical protein
MRAEHARDLGRGIAAWYVKRDPQGHAVLFPWGTRWRGRVVEDEALLARALRLCTIRRATILTPCVVVASWVVLDLGGNPALVWLALLLLAEAWYQLAMRRLLAGLPVSPLRLTRADLRDAQTAGRDPFYHWLTLLLALPLLWIGSSLAWGEERPLRLVGAVLALASLVLAALQVKALRGPRQRGES